MNTFYSFVFSRVFILLAAMESNGRTLVKRDLGHNERWIERILNRSFESFLFYFPLKFLLQKKKSFIKTI